MDEKKNVTFEEIFEQNKNRIHYQIHKLGIQDPHNEYYVEGMYAMWTAYKKYQPNKGPLATYFNYTIKNRLIDRIRKQSRDSANLDKVTKEEQVRQDNGNRNAATKMPLIDPSVEITRNEDLNWENVQSRLTENQWKWVYYAIILEMPQKEIAQQEGVTVEAVKSWAKTAKRKLRNELSKGDFFQRG
ncbi:sigma-70 family RNA polymerase sigma factor [Oceanobacillus halotolerans]|uniref:sigma-70 family RNA polymerase sigma factor n=1 Tax=Oceanobacillus halotolerans TaxID=2663380 RepID=UPI0013DCE71A|nr:sigma-70 family RNA polymerase sigma factor [Oceanobacillus halotolerans]